MSPNLIRTISFISRTQLVNNNKPLVVILGPTAVGKTGMSIQLADLLGGEIVSADSRLFYRGMDIGTAKPSEAERLSVPHHLIDVADPNQVWSLAKFQRAAYRAIDHIHDQRKIPFLVGGTGQYIRSVTEGWKIPEVKPDVKIREALQRWAHELGPVGIHERLFSIDSRAANMIQPTNLRRTVRALEVIFLTGKLFSEQKGKSGTPYQILTLGITRPRSELYQRIDDRIQQMVVAGFIEEVDTLLKKGYSPDLPPLSAIGYRQMIEVLQGKISLGEAVVQMKRLTRQFVRRQANWFKIDDSEITWFQADKDTVDGMADLISEFLNS